MPARTNPRSRRAARQIGEHLATWRKLQGLTAEVVADRAGVSRGTLRRLEQGSPTVGLGTVLDVARALGVIQDLADAIDPYETPMGRARANEQLPQRVRR